MRNILLGAIIGDMCGKPYEFERTRADSKESIILMTDKSGFTDDTVCTIAIAEAILNNCESPDFEKYLLKWCRRYPTAGYGQMFFNWFMCADKDRKQGNSYGNGSAMRVSACGWAASYSTMQKLSYNSALPTHSHPQGINGAQAIATCIREAISASSRISVYEVAHAFYPDFDFYSPLKELRKDYKFNCTCQGSVPYAIKCFLESISYEDCIRNAIWLGGDTDTIAAMAGSIAHAFYFDIPEYLVIGARLRLPMDMLEVIDDFDQFVSSGKKWQ